MRSLLAEPERPTAVVCLNYELTVGALIALNESGLRIPEDISFVGFDSLELSQVIKPRLSMVVQPTHEIAVRAADLMRRRLEPPSPSDEPDARPVPAGGAARRARPRRLRRPAPSLSLPTRPTHARRRRNPCSTTPSPTRRCWGRWPPPATARRCCWPTGTTPPRPRSRAGAEVIHLNLRPGLLSVTEVLGPLLEAVNIEAAHVMALPDGGARPGARRVPAAARREVAFSVVERFAFYEAARGPDVAFVVATGDQRICANLLLTIGVRT